MDILSGLRGGRGVGRGVSRAGRGVGRRTVSRTCRGRVRTRGLIRFSNRSRNVRLSGIRRRCNTSRVRILRKLRTMEGHPNVCVNSAKPEKLRRLICRVMSGSVSRTLTNCYAGVSIIVRGNSVVEMASGNHNVPINIGDGAKLPTMAIMFAILRTNKGFNKNNCGISNNLRNMNTSIMGTLSR